jgi:bifunctional DNA-binding transcriptional regulator/antitoxin component of YhaV-PrlF toxin-antitoxin module
MVYTSIDMYIPTRRIFRINKSFLLVIPRQICRKLNWYPGDVVTFQIIDKDMLRLIKLKTADKPL